MAKYIMALKGQGNKLNAVVWNTNARCMSEAKDYFVKLKNLPVQEFDKIFMVAEVGEGEVQSREERIFERNPDTGKIRSRRSGDYGGERDEN